MIVQIQPSVDIGEFIEKFGYNADVDASTGADEDITATGGDIYEPSAVVSAANINIVSTDTADDAAGTGARTLEIVGIDANYMLQSETVDLDGTTNVNPVNDYLAIDRAVVRTAGSGGMNAGIITIADGSGTFITIPAGFNQSLKAAYTIPADYKAGYLTGYEIGLANKTAAYVVGILQIKPFGEVWQTKDIFNTSSGSTYEHFNVIPAKIAAKSKIRLRIIDASADNLAVSGGFSLYLR